MKLIKIFIIFYVMYETITDYNSSARSVNYVRDACSVTRYQDICVQSLSSFSRTAKSSPSKWARAGVSVTVGEAKNVTQLLYSLKKRNAIKGSIARAALLDCFELFEDVLDKSHRSLGILRKLNVSEFYSQMEDLSTWMSASLTDADTCLDGFGETRNIERHDCDRQYIEMLRNRVTRVACLTSNALALINKLASTGLDALEG